MDSMHPRRAEIQFDLKDIRTATFPIPKSYLTSSKNRRFYVSVSDGSITKVTTSIKCEGQSLHWTQTLDGFTASPASQLILHVFEEHRIRRNKSLGIFLIPNEGLYSSQNEFLLANTEATSKRGKSSSRAILVSLSDRHFSETRDAIVEPDSGPVPNSSQSILPLANKNNSSPISRAKSALDKAREDAANTNGVSGLAASVADGFKRGGRDLTVIENAITSLTNFVNKRKAVLERIGFIVNAVNSLAEIHPYAKLAWSVLSYIPSKISEQIQLDEDVVSLLDAMETTLDLAPDTDTLMMLCKQSKNHEKTLSCMMEQVAECGYFIQSYFKDASFWKRAVKNVGTDGKKVVDGYRETLTRLRQDFLGQVIITVEETVVRTLAEVEFIGKRLGGLDINMQLRDLPYGVGTKFNPEKGCLPQTRVKFLDTIIDWVNNPDPSTPKVFMLFGQAGTGKSSIAHEVAHRFRRMGRLTTSYFFLRGNPSGREPYRFFTTLAIDLSTRHPAFKTSLGNVVNNNRELVTARDYTTLFDSLIRDPLHDVHFVGPVFVVIDALDECDDASNKGTLPFYAFLARRLSELPSNFRILITSRPEADIWDAFCLLPFIRITCIDDHHLAAGVDEDILTYMRAKLPRPIVDKHGAELVKRAEAVFQWAFVACEYVARPPRGLTSEDCIERILQLHGTKALNRLDELYKTVLEEFDMDDPKIRGRFQSVIGMILAAFEPLSVLSLNILHESSLFEADDNDVFVILKYMRSLLSNVTSADSTLPVVPLHTSFRDFLTDSNRSGRFYISESDAHHHLTKATLGTMQAMLRFNICNLETSYRLNREVPDLKERIQKEIPVALSYSCCFWSNHLVRGSKFDVLLLYSLRDFFEKKFLFWLEALSLLGEMDMTSTVSSSLRAWLGHAKDADLTTNENEELVAFHELIKDAETFFRYFVIPIARSAPHIYLSTIPFAPSSSVTSKLYAEQFPRTLALERGRLSQWPALLLTFSVPNSDVYCAALSTDDVYVAVGLSDGDSYIWNVLSGKIVCGPHNVNLEGSEELGEFAKNINIVTSVAFSHAKRYLASGLSNGKISIKDVVTADADAMPLSLNGHTAFVSSLSFSRDDKQLISGSADCTIRIWDLNTGTMLAGPFGDDNPISSVSFLPDKEHFISCSGSHTVHVRHVKTGQTAIGSHKFDVKVPIGMYKYRSTCHCIKESCMHCPRQHANGKEVVAYDLGPSSTDRTSWAQITALSPDGRLLATCTSTEVFVWYVTGRLAGTIAGGPFRIESAISLAFSVDSQRIVVSTLGGELSPGVVHILKAEVIKDPNVFSKKDSLIRAVAYSSDGQQIVIKSERPAVVQVLNASTAQEECKFEWPSEFHVVAPPIAFSSSGNLMALGRRNGMDLHVLNLTTGVSEPLRVENNSQFLFHAFSAQLDDHLVVATETGIAALCNASTGALLAGPKKIGDAAVTCLALYSAETDGTGHASVALGITNGELFVWDTVTENVVGPFTPHGGASVVNLVISPDGKYITSVANDYSICVWDAGSGAPVRGPLRFWDDELVDSEQRPDGVTRLNLAQDGRKVAFEGRDYSVVVVHLEYDIKGADRMIAVQHTLRLAGHLNTLCDMAFSPDGRFLVTISYDDTLRMWDLRAAEMYNRSSSIADSANLDIAQFTDGTFIDEDGWITCESRSGGPPLRLLWVPKMQRRSLHRPSNVFVIGGHETRLDLGSFAHGENWVNCKA